MRGSRFTDEQIIGVLGTVRGRRVGRSNSRRMFLPHHGGYPKAQVSPKRFL